MYSHVFIETLTLRHVCKGMLGAIDKEKEKGAALIYRVAFIIKILYLLGLKDVFVM